MIDGLKIYYRISNFEEWKRTVKIDLFTPTDLDTGETKGKTRAINGVGLQTITYRGNLDTYKISIKETSSNRINENRTVSHLFILEGSLHKNQFNGANYLPFTWQELQNQIEYLETSLQLNGQFAEIVNLEIGLNIELPFPVFPFLNDNLLVYKCTPFNRYNPDKNGVCLGYVCSLRQYSVKIYDKGLQFDLPYHLMRFELRFLKMQPLKEKGIKVIQDLKNLEKIRGLKELLLNAWDNILLFENSIDTNDPNLKPKDRNLLTQGNNPKFWENLKKTNTRRFNYQRSKFKELVTKYGKGNHEKIRELINKEWDSLIQNRTILPRVQNPELYNLTVKVKGKNVQFIELVKKRFCLSCGNDISRQDNRSRFCSPKFVGEVAAHKCRNKDSNQRNNFKNKIDRITKRGLLFDILPFIAPHISSTLHKKV